MPVPYFDSQREFIEFLEETLIPDLKDGGQRSMAQDFEESIYWMTQRFGKSLMKTKRGRVKRKVKQSPKQKLLTQMTKKKWDKYKRGSGKKTYVEIRAQVSRSQEFKRKSKRL